MVGRKLNAMEQTLHQTAINDPNRIITQKQVDMLIADPAARLASTNFLLGTGMFRVLRDAKGASSYRAVSKIEMDAKKDLTGEETLVLNHIQAAANEGIWTKHLKGKTELHQTVLDRCLKSLVQKQLIKTITNVRHRTRKTYMLFHLEPSVEITGGPWYSDNELDMEFIKTLSQASLKFIQDRSFARSKSSRRLLYASSEAPSYPTSQQILAMLSKSKITETPLTVEHVEMLLNVLVIDGLVERVPSYGLSTAMDNFTTGGDSGGNDSNHAGSSKFKPKSKSKSKSKSKKRKKRSSRDSESDSESSSALEDEDKDDRKSRKRVKKQENSDEEHLKSLHPSSDVTDGGEIKIKKLRKKEKGESKKSKRKRSRNEAFGSESENEDEMPRKAKRSKSKSKTKTKSSSRSRSRSRSKSKSRAQSSGSDSDSESNSDSDSSSNSSDSEDQRSTRKRSKTAEDQYNFYDTDIDTSYIYRAIRPERVALGWSEAPCGQCPQLAFCSEVERGPVNPKGCEYYTEWLGRGSGAIEEEGEMKLINIEV